MTRSMYVYTTTQIIIILQAGRGTDNLERTNLRSKIDSDSDSSVDETGNKTTTTRTKNAEDSIIQVDDLS